MRHFRNIKHLNNSHNILVPIFFWKLRSNTHQIPRISVKTAQNYRFKFLADLKILMLLFMMDNLLLMIMQQLG